jgi:hypothetical protein
MCEDEDSQAEAHDLSGRTQGYRSGAEGKVAKVKSAAYTKQANPIASRS